MSDELKSKQTNEQTINEELSNQNKNNDGFLSNKFICWMVVLNLFLRSMMVILQGVTEIANERPYSGLWILIIPTMIIFFNILLWVSLALSIKNIKKPKPVYLILIAIFTAFTFIFDFYIQSYKWFGNLFYWLYAIQTVMFVILTILKIISYYKNIEGNKHMKIWKILIITLVIILILIGISIGIREISLYRIRTMIK